MIFEIILYNLFLLNYNDNIYILQTLQYICRFVYIIAILILLQTYFNRFLFLSFVNFINLKFLWKKIFTDNIIISLLTLHDHILNILNFLVEYIFRFIPIPKKILDKIEFWDTRYICYISNKEKELIHLLKKEIMSYLISKNTPSKSSISKEKEASTSTSSRRNREKLFLKVKKT